MSEDNYKIKSGATGRFGARELAFMALCLAFFIGHGIYSARVNSVTADEYVHLPVALSILQTGDVQMDHFGSPPLRALLALPALASHPAVDYTSTFWRTKEFYQFSWTFMRDNFSRYSSLFFAPRMAALATGVLLCLLLALAARRFFGKRAALIATLLFCFNPGALAHSSLVTVDMLAACFFLPAFSASCCSCKTRPRLTRC